MQEDQTAWVKDHNPQLGSETANDFSPPWDLTGVVEAAVPLLFEGDAMPQEDYDYAAEVREIRLRSFERLAPAWRALANL